MKKRQGERGSLKVSRNQGEWGMPHTGSEQHADKGFWCPFIGVLGFHFKINFISKCSLMSCLSEQGIVSVANLNFSELSISDCKLKSYLLLTENKNLVPFLITDQNLLLCMEFCSSASKYSHFQLEKTHPNPSSTHSTCSHLLRG